MNELQNFNFSGQDVRIITINDEPWFVGKDVADILGYSNSRKALSDHVDDEDKGVTKSDTLGGNQNITIINESGLYSLILKSKKPEAKQFKRWVTSEVLPTIRKHGAYMTNDKAQDVLNGNGLADLLIQAGEQLKEKDVIISQLKPKALFAEAVESSKGSILVRDLAKILKQNNVEIGEKRLFSWLRDNGYLIKKLGSDYNSPTQRSMNLGVMEFTENTVVRNSGDVILRKTPKITGKGQTYFVGKFLNRSLSEQYE